VAEEQEAEFILVRMSVCFFRKRSLKRSTSPEKELCCGSLRPGFFIRNESTMLKSNFFPSASVIFSLRNDVFSF
jgi:hypothetical protein